MIDTNDDDLFGQLDIASDVGESGPYTFDTDLSDGDLEGTTCDARRLYFEVRVTEGSTVHDSKRTPEISRGWYDCGEGVCVANRSNQL